MREEIFFVVAKQTSYLLNLVADRSLARCAVDSKAVGNLETACWKLEKQADGTFNNILVGVEHAVDDLLRECCKNAIDAWMQLTRSEDRLFERQSKSIR